MESDRLAGAKIRLPEPVQRFNMTYGVDEPTLANIKLLNIHTAGIIKESLAKEITKRSRARNARLAEEKKKQIVNRFSGEVLSTR